MIEFIKHSLGLCGEPHFNLIHLLFGAIPGISYIRLLVNSKLNRK
jgi:hypothetical protein